MASFPHRTNPDGTIDSICLRCFATIGNAHSETRLEQMEADHLCDRAQLLYFDEAAAGAKQPPGIESSRIVVRINRAR
jgi:hypothetical protein